MRFFVLHVIAADNYREILRDIQRLKQRCDKRRRLVGYQPQRNAFSMQNTQRLRDVREQEAALFDGLFVETIEQFAQNTLLLFLWNISVIDARFTLCGTL